MVHVYDRIIHIRPTYYLRPHIYCYAMHSKSSVAQERKRKVHCRVHKIYHWNYILSQVKPGDIVTLLFFKMCFNIILHITHWSHGAVEFRMVVTTAKYGG